MNDVRKAPALRQVYPVSGANGRQRTAQLFAERPEASLREITADAGVSPAAAAGIRRSRPAGDAGFRAAGSVPRADASALIERENVVTAMDGMLTAAVRGSGQIAVVSGPMATGKSGLLEVLAGRSVNHGALPVHASGSRSERTLPLALLSQLLHNAPLARTELRPVLELLREGAANTRLADPDAERVEQADAALVNEVCTLMLRLSDLCPLAVLIDDVHYADRASLLCLVYLARRMRNARQLIVMSQSEDRCQASSLLETELLRQPHCRRFELAPLSEAGVAELAGEQVGEERAARLAARWHALSGGNPLLVRGLVKDHQDNGDEIGAAGCFARAVVSCLRRAEPQHRLLAQGLAILGTEDGLTSLLGTDAASVEQSLQFLQRAGLVAGGGFRHEAARSAVLSDMDCGTRTKLYRAAAEVAHGLGAPAGLVAEHLRASGDAGAAPWAVTVLVEAAHQALADGSVETAVDYLALAERACGDHRRRAAVKTTLALAEWQISPARSVKHLAELTDASRTGQLGGADSVVLASALLWHGRFDDARAVLEPLSAARELDADTVTELHASRPWLRSHYPSFLPFLPQVSAEQASSAQSAIATTERLESATVLSEILAGGPRNGLAASAECILRGSQLGRTALETVESALLALVYGERTHQAMPWCDLFIKEAAARCGPGHQARLAAIRAEICLRLGDLPGGELYARQALRLVPRPGWGVAIGGVTGTLLLVLTGMGRHDDATSVVGEPVPDAMRQSRYGLHFLYARARHYLAMNNVQAALRDLQACGEQMIAWDLDAPGLLPWRVEAAEAYLRLDQRAMARKLVKEHLALAGAHAVRAHGMGLRLLAATAEPCERPPVLRRAAAMLQAGKDRHEQAKVLADLADAHHALGDFRRARMIRQRAERLARECAAEPLIRAMGPDSARSPADSASRFPAGQDAATVLSRAERRVGALAAAGYTNRQIASKLYITVSTVEQHLSRVYRKLNVARRTDLPSMLEFS